MIDIDAAAVTVEAPPTVRAGSRVVDAAASLRRADVRALAVRDATDAVVGIVTRADVVAAVADRRWNRPVESVASTPAETVAPSASLREVAGRMRDAGTTVLPVVDDDDTCRGVVTRETLKPYLARPTLDVDRGGESVPSTAPDDGDVAISE